jgi:hypothetical protein
MAYLVPELLIHPSFIYQFLFSLLRSFFFVSDDENGERAGHSNIGTAW